MHVSSSCLRRGLSTAVFAFAAIALHAAGSFEGRVEMTITNSAQPGLHVINYSLKEGKMRLDIPKETSGRENGAAGGMIVDYEKQEMLILMEMPDRQGGSSKMFMRRPLPQPSDVPATAKSDLASMDAPVPTGRTETICGYQAAEYKGTGKNGEIYELWLAKGLGGFLFPTAQNPMVRNRSASTAPAWEKMVREGGFFPLRAITRDAKGAEKTRMEVTKIEKASLPESLFSAEGYSEFQIPGFGSGLPAGLNPFKH